MANKMFERTMVHRGHAVLAIDCVFGGAQWQSWPAARQDRLGIT